MIEAAATLARPAEPRHVPRLADTAPVTLAGLCREWQRLRDRANDYALSYEESCIASDLSYEVEQTMLRTPARSLADAAAFLAAYARHVNDLANCDVPFIFRLDLVGARLLEVDALMRRECC